MNFTARTVALPVILALVAASFGVVAEPSGASDAISIRILLDLADGTYYWSESTIPDPEAPNATWNAVLTAAGENGLTIEWSWFPEYGAFLEDVGDRNPPGGVGVYLWNRSTTSWEFTQSGISSLVVRDGDGLALYDAGYGGPPDYEPRFPVPTPDHAYPSLAFRSDLANSGTSQSPAPGTPAIHWDRDLGIPEIGSTPSVAYGRVYLSTMRGFKALDEETGEVIWENPAARGFSSPAVFDESVFVGSSNGTVYRMNATDGQIEWSKRLLAETGFSGITSSPKVVFDWVYIGTFNESGGPGEVVSLWASNGTVRWRVPTGSVHFSSPAFADGTIYVGIMGRYNTTTQVTFDPPYGVLALDAATGHEKWFYETSGSVAASPAVAGPRLIVTSKDGNAYAIDRATGSLDWLAAVGAGVSSPAVWHNTAFIGGGAFGGSGRVVALDTNSGAEKWSFEPNGPVQASVTYADGKVFFSTNVAHGRIYGLNATTGSSLWSFEPSPAEYILGSPVVADGVVFAPSDNGHVYALSQAATNVQPPNLFLLVVELGAVAAVAVGLVLTLWFVRRRSRLGP